MATQIVHRVEEGMDRQDILCTTYQMRNFYRQLGDGFFTALDIFNYIQHYQIMKWCKPGFHVLDMCCGRGLMLPLLRYHAKEIGSYTGVDIEPKNAMFTHKRVTDGKPIDLEEYYPFPVRFVKRNVADMAGAFKAGEGYFPFDIIIYTSSIEHMHKDTGEESLRQAKLLGKPGTRLVLTCPNTPEGKSGYETQYRAHVYEWKREELLEVLDGLGFNILWEWGLLISKRDLMKQAEKAGLLGAVETIAQVVPNEFLCPVFAPLFPKASKEIGFLAEIPNPGADNSVERQLRLL